MVSVKIVITLIYSSMLLCANMSWSHDSPEFKKLKTFNEGELRNLIYPSREKYIPAFAIINKNDKKNSLKNSKMINQPLLA